MPLIYEPRIFAEHADVRAAMSEAGPIPSAYGFNMSLTVGDDPARVEANRARLAGRLGFGVEQLVTQRQVHGDRVVVVDGEYERGDSDAMVTGNPGHLLAISIADCIPVLLYDPVNHAVGGVHSGWRGTRLNVTGMTIATMREEFGTDAEVLRVYVGAAARQCCYEVGAEVAREFEGHYSREIGGGKYLFDNPGVVFDQLLASGVSAANIELDMRCTICDDRMQSYRRGGLKSGRAMAVIGMVPAG